MNIWPWIAIALWLLGAVLFYRFLEACRSLHRTDADEELLTWKEFPKQKQKFGCLFWPVAVICLIVDRKAKQ
ncbi:hypothetical protein [Microbulbifer sp. 2205BS26-8]|uniref:hypothetical protein n=1 Tax=Microbulbifer sp. 2205BS26-8 TaxID=3064386 RepID=UPI0027401BA0|nr:hypothetical protein [Microbulbifer sp. 2205BS26-8]MDP5211180.1 hypothetical protein [Microbulbifer sp. 2205BS26-8]